ncbi:RING-HC finger protein [Streptomyces sp. 1222.5]|uniref:RING-HC finger protein n=1 Tax=Streptomyces sp. 1222.5 TaxID=1881026 RepID=UPI003D716DBD
MAANPVDCPVCNNQLRNGDFIRLNCSHFLCQDCWEGWLAQPGGHTCPICRAETLDTYLPIVNIPGMGLHAPITNADVNRWSQM